MSDESHSGDPFANFAERALSAIPRVYEIPEDLERGWNNLEIQTEIIIPKVAIDSLMRAIDILAHSAVHNLSLSMALSSQNRMEVRRLSIEVGTAAVEAQSAARRAIAMIAALNVAPGNLKDVGDG